MGVRPDPAKLNCTTNEGAAGKERAYAQWHRQYGQRLKRKYQPK